MNVDKHFLIGWMKRHQLSAADAAPMFGITKQTLYNWCSNGIPETKVEYITRVTSEYDKSPAAAIGPRIVISPTEEQFRNWNRAALDEGQLIEDWAVDSLEKAADLHFAKISTFEKFSKVAEDETPYKSDK
ncbi:MAG: hypothetical protein V4727_00490 [Verrucomicrobiota bacterium]